MRLNEDGQVINNSSYCKKKQLLDFVTLRVAFIFFLIFVAFKIFFWIVCFICDGENRERRKLTKQIV